MIKALWSDMRCDDFADPALADAVAVLPIAAIEQHGPHLPTGTDTILAEGYIDAVLAQKPDDLPIIFLPVQPVGWSEEHLDGAGTLTSNWQAFVATLDRHLPFCEAGRYQPDHHHQQPWRQCALDGYSHSGSARASWHGGFCHQLVAAGISGRSV